MLLAETHDIREDVSPTRSTTLSRIEQWDHDLYEHYRDKFVPDPSLNRSLVSFQANKTRPAYRWYKYKEAFSAALVEYLLRENGVSSGPILDPFAGSGTALFAASDLGLEAEGIELLPIGHQLITAKRLLETEFTQEDFAILKKWATTREWEHSTTKVEIPELRITAGAYPDDTKTSMEKYVGALQHETPRVRRVLRFALLCVLEIVSYTRKDGQYLRWDYRSGRKQGKKAVRQRRDSRIQSGDQ